MSRKIDKLIAEHIFGLKISKNEKSKFDYCVGEDEMSIFRKLHYYSTRIDSAWEVVEKLIEMGMNISVGGDIYTKGCYIQTNLDLICANDKTVPLAICKAALKVFGVEYETE